MKYKLARDAVQAASKKLKPYKWTLNVARNAGVGAIAGGISGHVVSDAHGSEAGKSRGMKVGAVAGAVTGLPFGRIAKTGYRFSKVVARGLKATPSSKIGAGLRAADKAGHDAGVVFRRIRGRIVAIRKKK